VASAHFAIADTDGLAYFPRENFAASYFAGRAARLATLILTSFAPAAINDYFPLQFRQGIHLMLIASINLGCPFAICTGQLITFPIA
jgi:hypothetical protein